MGIWQNAKTGEMFDDKRTDAPGEPDFTSEDAKAMFGDDGFNYVGCPGWSPATTEA